MNGETGRANHDLHEDERARLLALRRQEEAARRAERERMVRALGVEQRPDQTGFCPGGGMV
jgi:hypothetical protein